MAAAQKTTVGIRCATPGLPCSKVGLASDRAGSFKAASSVPAFPRMAERRNAIAAAATEMS